MIKDAFTGHGEKISNVRSNFLQTLLEATLTCAADEYVKAQLEQANNYLTAGDNDSFMIFAFVSTLALYKRGNIDKSAARVMLGNLGLLAQDAVTVLIGEELMKPLKPTLLEIKHSE